MTTLAAFLWIIGLTAITYAVAESTLAIWRDWRDSRRNRRA